MTIERHTFTAAGPTEDEMLDILRERVSRVYGFSSLEEYAEARCHGRLPDVPGRAALEVFAGDFGRSARSDASARPERVRG